MIETSPRTLIITTSDDLPPWVVEWHRVLDSTMNRASELARRDVAKSRVVVADFQSSGRGTQGRDWIAPTGTCLMFSFVVHPQIEIEDLQLLPRRIAATVRDELNTRFGLNVAVDPPNDLTIDGSKIAGVLCQSHLRAREIEWLVCGIGLNTNLSEPELTVPNSTSLAIKTGLCFDHKRLLGQLLGALDHYRRM